MPGRKNTEQTLYAAGTQQAHVVSLVLSSAAKTVSVGILAGVALCMACNGPIAHWLSAGIYDPVMLSMIAGLLLGATGLAAFVPARRAAGCDPVEVLRTE